MDCVQNINIEQELKRLHEAQEKKKEVRASLFTLIIYVHEESRAKYLREIVQNVIEKFPCRIIFIKADRNPASDHLRVTVSSAQNTKGGGLIVCDQINIEAGMKAIKKVPFLILPHTLPDLPVYLLWGQDATAENEILPILEKLANRFIFDAECTKSLSRFSEETLSLKSSLDIELVDINWALCCGWRDVIMQAFYQPEHLEQLIKTKNLQLIYNDKESDWIHQPEMQSIYVQAWIASRLGWQYQSMTLEGQTRTFIYSSENGDLKVVLSPAVVDSAPPGGILCFESDSSDGYHFLLERDHTQPKVTVNCSSQVLCELPFGLPLLDIRRGFTFMNEIFYSIPSHHYVDVLKLLTRIDWQ